MNKNIRIGVIGQGFIGGAYADDFEERGYTVVRYAKDPRYARNKKDIAHCDVVFIAVPTPTTPKGFDISIVREVVPLVGEGKVAVIKSTVLPGSTEEIQRDFPHIRVAHAPEFLRAAHARQDAKKPERNIIGVTEQSRDVARMILNILPRAPYERVVPAREAELIKYMGNIFLAQKVIFANLMYNVARQLGADYDRVADAVGADPRITHSHLQVSHDGGRGAGGYCFIKDLAAFVRYYRESIPDDSIGAEIFSKIEEKNVELLASTSKDTELLQAVYGEEVVSRHGMRRRP